MTDGEHQELRVISSTPVIVGVLEAVTQPDLPRAFNGYQTGSVDALIADLSRRIRELTAQVAVGRDREAVLQTQIGQREEKIRALREERDKAAHNADNPWGAVGSAAQQVVNAARADAKRTLDKAGKRRDQLLARGEKAVEDAKARAAETTAKADETARRTVAGREGQGRPSAPGGGRAYGRGPRPGRAADSRRAGSGGAHRRRGDGEGGRAGEARAGRPRLLCGYPRPARRTRQGDGRGQVKRTQYVNEAVWRAIMRRAARRPHVIPRARRRFRRG